MKSDRKSHDGLPPGLSELGEWHISEFTNDDAGLTVRGKFNVSPLLKLDADQTKFLLTFLRCRGVFSSVQKELGISYPTARGRLDALLAALGLQPAADDSVPSGRTHGINEQQQEILAKLERGEISPEEAKKAIKEVAR